MDTSHVLTLKMSGKQEIRFQVPPKLLGKLIDRPSFLCVWSEFISRTCAIVHTGLHVTA